MTFSPLVLLCCSVIGLWYLRQTDRTDRLHILSIPEGLDKLQSELLTPSVAEYIRLLEASLYDATTDHDAIASDVRGLTLAEQEIFANFIKQRVSSYIEEAAKPIPHEPGENDFLRKFVLHCLQVGGVSTLWKLNMAKFSREGKTSPRLFSKGMLSGYSLLPVIYCSCLNLCGIHSLQTDQDRWQPLYGKYYLYIFPALLLGFISFYGVPRGLVHATGWFIRYEAAIFLLACVGDAMVTLLLPTSTRRVPNLRNKPRYATLLLLQLAIEYWTPMLSPVTLTAILCVFLWSSPEDEYLTKNAVQVPVTRPKVFCATCSDTILAAWHEDKSESRDQSAIDYKLVKRLRKKHHRSEVCLKQAASEGCRICTAVWEQRLRTPKDLWADIGFWRPATSFAMDGDLAIIYQEGNRHLEKYRCTFGVDDCGEKVPVTADNSIDNDLTNCVTDECITGDTASHSSLKLVKRWLQDCLNSHSCDGITKRSDFTPKRLIFLGAPPKTSPVSLNNLDFSDLCLQTGVPAQKSYMTLSHCWGGITPVRLLSTNENELQRQIDFDSLPPTFKDAMRLAKWLGSEYLWIDSLCIVQDLPEDFHEEVARMGQIYRYSLCNIAASDAASSKGGCFFKRNPYALKPEFIQVRGRTHVLLNRTDIYRSDHVLYTRAWVLQEAYLAPRTIDCGRGQLFWRCSRRTASEIFPYGVTQSVPELTHPADSLETITTDRTKDLLVAMNMTSLEQSLIDLQDLVDDVVAVPNIGPTRARRREPFGMWSLIVQTFTTMNLTLLDDRLNALDGIIDILRPYLGKSTAGIWECFLPFELLWKVDSVSHRKRPLRAPSWSWQSLNCFISYQQCYFDPDVDELVTRFMGFQPDSSHNDQPTGIMLSGPLLGAFWDSSNDPSPHKMVYEPIPLTSVNGKQRKEMPPVLNDTWGSIYLDELITDLRPENKNTFWDDVSPIKGVYCLPIFKQNTRLGHESSVGKRKPHYKGLLLKVNPYRVGSPEARTYERIGYFEDDGACLEPFINARAVEKVIIV